MPQWVENKGMPCLSKAFQPSKKPRPRLCSYNPKLGACRRAPQPGKDLQESIQPPCHTAFCPRHPLSWSCKHAHASQGHTHTSSSTWIPHPENRMSPSPQAQPKGGDRPHSVLQADCRQCTQSLSHTHARRWSGAHTSGDTVGTVTRTGTGVWGGRNMRAHI